VIQRIERALLESQAAAAAAAAAQTASWTGGAPSGQVPTMPANPIQASPILPSTSRPWDAVKAEKK